MDKRSTNKKSGIMNPVQSHPTLHIVSNPTSKLHTNIQPLRYIEPQQGIIWAMVAPVFTEHGWQLTEHTTLFIKAYHKQSKQTVIVSKMNCGHVLINTRDNLFGTSQLHEIEDLADVQPQPITPTVKHPWINELMTGLRKLIS